MEHRYKQESAGLDHSYPGRNMEGISLICREHQCPPFDCGLANEPLPKNKLPGLLWAIESKAANSNQPSVTLVGNIKSSIEQCDGLRETRKQTSPEGFKILGRLQPL